MHCSTNKIYLVQAAFLLLILLTAVPGQSQFRGDHITGFGGLDSGTQPPPGLYLGNIVWIYHTSTVKDDNGNKINSGGSLTSTADVILVNWVTNVKLFGANFGMAAGIPFIKNRVELNSLDVSSSLAFTDTFYTPLSLGWHFKRADVTAAYNFYAPTGTFSATGLHNSGLGMWGNEFTLGSTAFLDQKKSWTAAANFGLEFHTQKSGTNITVGDMGTIEGGLGKKFFKKVSGPIPMITTVGAAGYVQFKVTGDNGSGIPPALRGFNDRVFALGPEANVFIPGPRLTIVFRYLPEFGARNRTQGQTFVVSLVWVAKSLVKPQP